jgi:poly-gamma-glutamate synthase PgsB/CapB
MALIPHLQFVTEQQMIKSQVGVITNIREDHLDVMGPTVEDVGQALCNSIPRNSILFTAEKNYIDIIQKRADEVGTKVVSIDPSMVYDEDLRGFSYLEHKDNVALALSVCQHLGVDKDSALRGMYTIQPDPGALRKYRLNVNGINIEFINAFAANDPDSYRTIWKMLHLHKGNEKKLIVLVNSRRDRIQRAEQLGEFIARELEADYFVVSGEATRPLVNKAIKNGLSANRIKDLGGHSVVEIFNYISNLAKQDMMVVGIGNIVGLGEEIVRYFANKGRMVA